MIPRLTYPLLFLGVLCMATSSILVRYSTAPSIIIAFFRLGTTAVLGSGLTIGTGQNLTFKPKQLGLASLAGFFLALHFAFWITSLSYTSIASSVLFTNLQVVFVWLFSVVLLKESVTRQAAIGIIIAVGGSVLVGGGDFFHGHLKGDLISLASGLFIAIYLLIGRYIRKDLDIWPYTTLVSAFAALILAFYALITGLSFTGYPSIDYLLFGLMALIPGLGGHAVLNWALKYLKAPLVAVSILGESVGASILGYMFFNEGLAWFQIIGGVLILAGIYLAVSRDAGKAED
ncbi:MAG: DMT family transporter [Chitinophagales bacterium]